MRLPSTKTILTNLPWLDKIDDPHNLARQIRNILQCPDLAHLREYCDKLDIEEGLARWDYTRPHEALWYDKLYVLDKLLQTHGIESIYAKEECILDYLNTGDSYIPTILYVHQSRTFRIQSIGDWIEKHDPKGTKYN